MNAKIMLLMPDRLGETFCDWAEQLIGELSLSFGHAVTFVREKIGERSHEAWGAALTDETVEACRECAAVFCGNTDAEGVADLLSLLKIPLRIREFYCTGCYDDLQLCRVTDTDPATLNKAVNQAFYVAGLLGKPLMHTAPNGNNAALNWMSAVKVVSQKNARVYCQHVSAERLLTALLSRPQELGVVLLPPYLGRLTGCVTREMCNTPACNRERGFSKEYGFYAPMRPEKDDLPERISPVGTVLCVRDLLRYSLGMENEADCLNVALQNVLAAGWHTPDMPGNTPSIPSDRMMELIIEQIELAGAFMNKGGMRPDRIK